MTRKDYVLIANAIREARQDIETFRSTNCIKPEDDFMVEKGISLAEKSIASALRRDNTRFDYIEFRNACNN